jgi:hypothetical protein
MRGLGISRIDVSCQIYSCSHFWLYSADHLLTYLILYLSLGFLRSWGLGQIFADEGLFFRTQKNIKIALKIVSAASSRPLSSGPFCSVSGVEIQSASFANGADLFRNFLYL